MAATVDERLEQFQRFVLEEPSEATRRRYRSACYRAYRKAAADCALELVRRVLGRTGSDPRRVQGGYNSFYAMGVPALVRYLAPTTSAYLLFRGKPYLAGVYSIKRVQLVHLVDAARVARAKSILEIGFGSGMNLVSLAILQPALDLTGIEFTFSGVKLARTLAASPPPELLRFLGVDGLNDDQRAALSRIRFIHASASSIPLPDKGFDLVFTNLVLEQMGWNHEYRRALAEARRLAKKRAVFIECFRECNNRAQRVYLTYKNYFRDRWQRFGDYGFEPVSFSDDVPAKFLNHSGVLVCDVR